MRKIIVGTYNFYKEENSIEERIDKVLSLNVDGIELGFTSKDLTSFNLTEEIKSKLSNFSIIGIHAPNDIDYPNEKVISLIKEVYDKLNASYVVFHMHRIKDFSMFNETKYNFCMENDRKKWDFDHTKIKKIKEEFPNLKIVFDICHAMEYSLNEPKILYDMFGEDVKVIHLSVSYGNEKRHQPLHEASDDILKKIDFIKKTDCPITIELWFPTINLIKKEINFLREFL